MGRTENRGLMNVLESPNQLELHFASPSYMWNIGNSDQNGLRLSISYHGCTRNQTGIK